MAYCDQNLIQTRSRLWLVYFTRAAHHLSMRMCSDQPDLAMIEVLTHLDATIGPTIQLSAQESLDNASLDSENLRTLLQQGCER